MASPADALVMQTAQGERNATAWKEDAWKQESCTQGLLEGLKLLKAP